jgi:ectoine hydroxylase-related dioxygenase (phytanoyl-CoA dioxygenase family)
MSGKPLKEVLRARPFAPLRQGVRGISDYFHYRPLFRYEPRVVVRGAFSSLDIAEALGARGICILENVLDGGWLQRYRDAFDSIFTGPDGKAIGRTDVPGTLSRMVDFTQFSIFADLALHELVLAAVEAYYKRPIYLVATQANRLEPVAAFEGDSYQWHHDAKGKYVKAMWLLTDVARDGQRMSYVAGSHRLKHHSVTYADSRVTSSQAVRHGEIVECAAPAGSVVIFDTNGLHRGNRNPGPGRDVIFGIYSAGRYLHGCRFNPDLLPRLTEWQRSILESSRVPSPGYGS